MKDLRRKSKADLLEQVEKLREELHQLRVAQVSGGAPAKVANIRTTRKNIARILTIISQITRQKVREEYKRQGSTLLPLDLRPKLTRKERLKLPEHLKKKKTPKQKRLIRKFPTRKFAVINTDVKLPAAVVQANVKALLSKKTDSRYRHYLVKKQHAMKFISRHHRNLKYIEEWDQTYNRCPKVYWKPKWKSLGKRYKKKQAKRLAKVDPKKRQPKKEEKKADE